MEHTAPTRLAHPQASNNAASSEAPQHPLSECCYNVAELCGTYTMDPVLVRTVQVLCDSPLVDIRAQGLGYFMQYCQPTVRAQRAMAVRALLSGESIPLTRATAVVAATDLETRATVMECFQDDVSAFFSSMDDLKAFYADDLDITRGQLLLLCERRSQLGAIATFLAVCGHVEVYEDLKDVDSVFARITDTYLLDEDYEYLDFASTRMHPERRALLELERERADADAYWAWTALSM